MFKSKVKNVQLLQHFAFPAAKVLKINDICKYFTEKCSLSAKFGNPMSIIAYGYSKGIVTL